MERKLTKVVGETEITETGKMCSCGTDVANYLCSWECHDTCGDGVLDGEIYGKKIDGKNL